MGSREIGSNSLSALTLAIVGFTGPALSQTSPAPEVPAASAPAESSPAAKEPASWDKGSIWRVMASPYTYHFHYSEDHKPVYMVGLERQRSDGWVLGGVYFSNSFGQPSAYLYGGKRFNNFTPFEPLFAQITGGLLYGYVDPYENKVPFNHNGFSPGAVLSVGWQFTPMWSAQVNVLGNSALMLQLSADFK